MNRSFKRNLRQRDKTARRNRPKARGFDDRPLELPDLTDLVAEIAPVDRTGEPAPALIELIPPRRLSDGSIAPAGYRVLAGSPADHEIESIEEAVEKMNARAEDLVPPK